MNTAQRILMAAALGAAALPLSALAQHPHVVAQASAASTAPAEMSEGEVRKVDLAARKVTLKHGPLKNLGMPGMTMAFEVGDPAMLGQLKVGQHVRFVADERQGRLTIVRLEAAK